MEDKLLKMFFETARWEYALSVAVEKDLDDVLLRELMTPQGRLELLRQILGGEYHIKRPYTAKIPKDNGDFRTVFVNTNRDRIFLSIVNDLLFEVCHDMVHPACKSYLKGVGCGKVVSHASKLIEKLSGENHSVIGWKSDLSKYFDSVPLRFIDHAFDMVEERHGKSKIIDIVREYYHNDLYFDCELQKEVLHYQSLKQGCAVASWLADVVLYHVDEKLSQMNGFYVRYSDDTLFIGDDYELAMQTMQKELEKMEMKLNPKKVEYLTNDRWFKFLGFAIMGKNISLPQSRIKMFQETIWKKTAKRIPDGVTYKQALKSVLSWLYRGDGHNSWASSVLQTLNVNTDIKCLNGFVIDCLRAVIVGKSVHISDIGGLGWERDRQIGCIARGKGRRVNTLRGKTDDFLTGYFSLSCMRNNLLYGREVYDTIVRTICA